jgi:hypothetical protein
MATKVEKTSNGIIYRSEKNYPIPDLDVLTLLFGEPVLRINTRYHDRNVAQLTRHPFRLRAQPSEARHTPPCLSSGPESNINQISRPSSNASNVSRSAQEFWYRCPWSRKRCLLRHLNRPLPSPCPRIWSHRRGWYLLRCLGC